MTKKINYRPGLPLGEIPNPPPITREHSHSQPALMAPVCPLQPVTFEVGTERGCDLFPSRASTDETHRLDILSDVSDQSAPSMVSLNSSGHKKALGASTSHGRNSSPEGDTTCKFNVEI